MGGRAARYWYVRPLAALIVLTFEYLAVSIVFDARQIVGAGGALGRLSWAGLVGPAVIAFGTALWMLGGEQIADALRSTPPIGRARLGTRVPAHVLCFFVFFAMTSLLFSGASLPPGPTWLWVTAWLVAGLLNVLSLIPIAFGTKRLLGLLRELANPLAMASLLAFLAMGAGLTTVTLWRRLNGVTLYSVAYVLDWFVSPIYFEPSELKIGTPDFWVLIAPICSGYEGIGLITVFLLAYMAIFHKRLRFPNVLVLIPAAIVLVWVFNVLRIVALIIIGNYWSPEIAVGGFHSKAGWLVFCGVALGAAWLMQQVPWFVSQTDSRPLSSKNPSAPFLLPLLAVVATSLVTGLFLEGFDFFYPARVTVALLVLAWYRDLYREALERSLAGRRLISAGAVGIGVFVYVVWIGIPLLASSPLAEPAPVALDELFPPLAVAWVVARVLGAVITVPIIEELAFRGFLLRRLIDSEFTRVPYEQWSWRAALISSIAFAALHQQWLGGLVAGLAYAYAQTRRGLLVDAIVAHAVTNFLIAMQVLVLGHWTLW